MASDAQHREVNHHPAVGKHAETSHNDLIHHANGVPKGKPEAKAKVAEEKHTLAKHPGKDDAHPAHHDVPKKDTPAKGHADAHKVDAHKSDAHKVDPHKTDVHKANPDKSHDKKGADQHLPHVTVEKAHDHTAKPHVLDPSLQAYQRELQRNAPAGLKIIVEQEPAPRKHTEAVKPHETARPAHPHDPALDALQRDIQRNAPPGMTVIVEGATPPTSRHQEAAKPPELPKPVPHAVENHPQPHTAEVHPPAHAAAHQEVAAQKPAPPAPETFTLGVMASYLESTSVYKAFENWRHPSAPNSASADIAHKPAPKSKDELQLESLKRGDCNGARGAILESWVTKNEASKFTYTAYTANDNNTGIAVGLLQWNQKRGSLPEFLRALHHQNEKKFDAIFGKYSEDLLSTKYVKKADFNGIPTLLNGMQSVLHDKEFQGVQDRFRTQQIHHSCETAHSLGFNSIRGEGDFVDAANQIGLRRAAELATRIPKNLPQSERIDRFQAVTDHDRQNGKDRNQRVVSGSNQVVAQIINLTKKISHH